MNKSKIKYQFSIKSKDELRDLSHEELLKYIENLQDNLIQEKPPKNSNNSSICPSSEIVNPDDKKKNQSLREKSDKKVGAQKGRVGKTLKQTDTPDHVKIVEFNILECKKCGVDISNVIASLKERRQVVDMELSSIKKKITEYRSFSKVCPECGYDNHDNSFTPSVTPNISYGANIVAMISYLSVSQYMSNQRVVSLLSNLFNITISEGSITNILARASKSSEQEILKIKKLLESTKVLGIDETGCKVDGSRYWHWAFQDSNNTLIVADKSRGTKVITNTFEDGFKNACVVHDNYSSYSTLECDSEQLCLAHKLRDLNYAIECDDTKLMKDIKSLFKEAMKDHKENLTTSQRVKLKDDYDATLQHLLTMSTIAKSETAKQIKSITKSKDKIFTFLLDENIPPDNNASERAIRNVKVKQKVSGQFKSYEGAKNYANIRSLIDTSRKRGFNEFESLVAVIQGNSVF